MRLQKTPCPALAKAKGVAISDKWIVITTGSSICIMDRNLQEIRRIEKVPGSYFVRISPDEQNVLLVSTSPLFYVLSLQDFSVRKCTLTKEYAMNLEGRAVWSPDGREIIVAALNKHSLETAVRIYNATDLADYRQLPDLPMTAFSIGYVSSLKRYLLAGRDLEAQLCPALAWFDGQNTTLHTVRGFDDICALNADYDETWKAVVLYGAAVTGLCEQDGTMRQTLSVSQPQTHKTELSDAFDWLGGDDLKKLQNLCAAIGLDDDEVPETIRTTCHSANGDLLFVGTDQRILVYDKEMKELLCDQPAPNGTEKLLCADDLLLAVSYTGVCMFRVVV